MRCFTCVRKFTLSLVELSPVHISNAKQYNDWFRPFTASSTDTDRACYIYRFRGNGMVRGTEMVRGRSRWSVDGSERR